MEFLKDIYYNIFNIINTIQWTDILDIIMVTYIVYKAIQLIKETRAAQLVKGIILLSLSYIIAVQFNFKTIIFIFNNIFNIGIIAAIILFQPEIRRALEQVGRSKLSKLNIFSQSNEKNRHEYLIKENIKTLSEAAVALSKTKTGALIVIERQTKLGDIIKSGTIVDARMSVELICNIFFHNSPLHDGAVIIKNSKLYAAGCFLPLMQRMESRADYGTRHRAAIGMSENSDALVLVVSEETGTISLALGGNLLRGFNGNTLKTTLETYLLPKNTDDKNNIKDKQVKKSSKTSKTSRKKTTNQNQKNVKSTPKDTKDTKDIKATKDKN